MHTRIVEQLAESKADRNRRTQQSHRKEVALVVPRGSVTDVQIAFFFPLPFPHLLLLLSFWCRFIRY